MASHVPLLVTRLALAAVASCAAQAGGPVVHAPAVEGAPAAARLEPPSDDKLTACALPWSVADVADGAGTVIVVCPGDAHRATVEPGVVAHSLDAALEPARHRVCDCAQKMPAPASVDLKVTTAPDDGTASVEADAVDEELDVEPAEAFYACVGTLHVAIPRAHSDACGGPKATFVYPLHVDLAK
ncbi:MAG TPA: hypothetical protein VGG39_25470 [Polyangiaceae bacterium]